MLVIFILVDTSVIMVFCVVVVDVVAVVALVTVVSVATVGNSILVSSAMTAKLDKWLDKHLTIVELAKTSVIIPSLDQLVRVSVLCMHNKKYILMSPSILVWNSQEWINVKIPVHTWYVIVCVVLNLQTHIYGES